MAVAALAVGGVVSTWGVLSHVVDEPIHLAVGLEWHERGTQRLHPENPPLARAAAGLGAWLAGHRLPEGGATFRRGVQLLYEGGDYEGNLAVARLGALPFFLLALVVVWGWARRRGGPRAGFLAVAAFGTLPPVLGHAGLGTTDVPFMATFALAAYALVRWDETPTRWRAAGAGAALGLAMATKFSALLFYPPCALALLVTRRLGRDAEDPPVRRRWARSIALGMLAAGVVFWGSYRFDVGRVAEHPAAARLIASRFPDPDSGARRLAESLADVPIPAPEAAVGVLFLAEHARRGHPAYLFGEVSETGFPSFYPVTLALKTPLPFWLLVLGSALALAWRGSRRSVADLAPAAGAAAVLAAAVPSTLNMGLRHVLAVYPLLGVHVGLGLGASMPRAGASARRLGAAACAALLLWQAATAAAVWPNWLAFFNPLAGSEPGRILVDSDLDWGQDLFQARRFFADREVDVVHIAYFGSVRLCDHGLPPLRWLPPGKRVSGWVAVSEMYFRDMWRLTYDDACERRRAKVSQVEDGYAWLREYEPVAIAGRSIRIYRVPEP